MAQTMVENGIAVAVVEYTLAPAATLDQIVDQIRRAIAGIYRQAGAHGVDPDRLWVCGSSAGAQLGAMALLTDWPGQFTLPANLIKGAVLVSGLFDLEPVRLCLPNTWLNLDSDAAKRNSPLGKMLHEGVQIIVSWGEYETNEFKRQSITFARSLEAQGVTVSATETAGRNHFDVVVDLADQDRSLCRETIAQMTASRRIA